MFISPPKVVTKKPSHKSPLQIQAPRGLYLEIALKFQIKQSKKLHTAFVKGL